MIELLLSIALADGTLTVTRTDDCYIHAEYENRLDAGPVLQSYEIDGAIVGIVKGSYVVPEFLTVYAFGQEYSVYVDDNTTGAVCVPYWTGA